MVAEKSPGRDTSSRREADGEFAPPIVSGNTGGGGAEGRWLVGSVHASKRRVPSSEGGAMGDIMGHLGAWIGPAKRARGTRRGTIQLGRHTIRFVGRRFRLTGRVSTARRSSSHEGFRQDDVGAWKWGRRLEG